METHKVETRTGLVFDAWIEGPEDGPRVVLLHGYPQSRYAWRKQIPVLAGAGFRVVAPDQRGYSPDARPDPADPGSYLYERLIQDVLDIADACGAENARFHLAGHDWGGQVAWGVTANHPDRIASLAVLSRPHPVAFMAALEGDPKQKDRSRHHRTFLDPATAGTLLANGAKRLRDNLAASNVPPDAIAAYAETLGTMPAMEAALAWYRAPNGLKVRLPAVTVPTIYIWGDADESVGRMAAEGTASQVDAPYRFEILPGIGHFSTDTAAERVSALMLEHFRAYPA